MSWVGLTGVYSRMTPDWPRRTKPRQKSAIQTSEGIATMKLQPLIKNATGPRQGQNCCSSNVRLSLLAQTVHRARTSTRNRVRSRRCRSDGAAPDYRYRRSSHYNTGTRPGLVRRCRRSSAAGPRPSVRFHLHRHCYKHPSARTCRAGMVRA